MKLVIVFASVVCCTVFSAPGYAQSFNSGRALATACFTCHGPDGNSVGGVPPSIAGRSSDELFATMKAFQAGKRPATVMHQQARGYTDEQLQAIATYFASVKPVAAAAAPRP